MKFLSLHFVAWGPFSDTLLDFSGAKPFGLHVIHGRNEAGKSTALRGVLALLYGIAERTPDAHSHPSKELCIRARIEGAKGTAVDVMRRKRRKDSLRDGADQPIDERLMVELLSGLGPELFQTLFGLDHQRLRAGGQALLEGRGDVGESLFDAGLGGRGIHRVLAELKSEAEKIFKPQGQKPLLNAALHSYREAMRRCRDAQHAPEKWQEQKQELARRKQERDLLIERRRQLQTESARLNRLRAALEPAARRRQRLLELREHGSLPRLADECEERRRLAQNTIARCRRDIERVEQRRDRSRKERALLAVPDELLMLSEAAVKELAAELAVMKSQRSELPACQAQIVAAEEDAVRVLRRLNGSNDLGTVEELRLTTAEQARLVELVQERALLRERLAQSEAEHRRAARELDEARTALQRLPAVSDVTALRRALGRVQASGDAESRYERLCADRQALRKETAELIGQLRPFEGTAERLLQITVPAPETIERFGRELDELAQKRARLDDDLERLRSDAAELARQIAAVEGAGDVPSEELLSAARGRRDHAWQLVRRAWQASLPPEQPTPEFDAGRPLAEAFEQAVFAADDVADRLRREAHRVTQLASLRADLVHAERRSLELAEKRRQLSQSLLAVEQQFRQAFAESGFEPLTPMEMRGWLARYARALDAVRRERDLSSDIEQRERQIVEARRVLGEALVASDAEIPEGLTLSELIEFGRDRLDEVAENRRARQNCERLLEESERRLSEALEQHDARKRELDRWETDWAAAVRPLALGEQPSVEEVQAVLGELAALFMKVDAIAAQRARARAIEQALQAFSARIRQIVSEHLPELLGLDEESAASELVQRHARALTALADRDRLDAELQHLEQELAEYEAELRKAESELALLLDAASVATAEELELLERKAKQILVIERDLEQDEASLSQTAHEEGLSLAELLGEVEGVDPATVRPAMEDLKEQLEELDEQLKNAALDIAEVERGLHLYCDERAVEAVQEAQVFAAQAVHCAERYARLRLAALLLERQVEQYRETNQGPIVGRASSLFSRLTLGRYKALYAGVEERVLHCVRHDGKELDVEGLSDGTRDQLYLALRLASLEQHLQSNEPMPLVLDDVLIHFDEERVRSALAVLAELAERTQILYFTHHARHVELARSAVAPGRLFEHELDAWRRAEELAFTTSDTALRAE